MHSENPHIRPYTNTCSKFKSIRELDEFIQDNDLFVTNINSSLSTFLGCVKFDFTIINEASLIVEPLALIPILYSQKFIMLGDYYQLNPVIKSYEADKKGMSISMFRKLCERHPYKVMILRESYNMNEVIASLSNTIAYKGLIRHANPDIKGMSLEFELDVPAAYPWLKELKSDERKVVMINTDNLLNKTLQK